ncbi:restriction endonuclease subunit S [Streptomyces mirabilis]|uniref:restriction endonuclease subunit S n=1 Tax=Streptomyces mirabilis TaxID=68239 RepID=UPI0036966B07
MTNATAPLKAFTEDAQTGPFGSQLHSGEYIEGGIPVINPSNIKDGRLIADQSSTVSTETAIRLKVHRLRAGDLVFARRGELGRAAVVSKEEEGWLCGTGSIRVRANHDQLDPHFAGYALQSAEIRSYFTQRAVGSTMGNLNTSIVLGAPVPIVPLEEQRRIADFLNAETTRIDGLVNAKQRVLDRLAERRTAGVVAAVSGGEHTERRESTLAWLESIPERWQEVRLGLLARMGSGHTPSRSHPEWWVDCTVPWITTGEVKQVRNDRLEDLYETRENISELGLANSAAELHPMGTVFLCRTAASAGYSGVMGSDMATSQDIVTWTCGPRLNPYYLLWCLRAMRPDLLGRLAMGSTHKTIYVPDLQMLRVPLPSLEEQREIVESIRQQHSRIDSLTDKVRRQIELLTERRQTLITAAVTGEFDVSTASGRHVADGVTA